MNERACAEASLVASAFPDLEVRVADGWARIPAYPIPSSVWTADEADVAFRFPEGLPGQAPYAFCVHPALVAKESPLANISGALDGTIIEFSAL